MDGQQSAQVCGVVSVLGAQRIDIRGGWIGVRLEEGSQDLLGGEGGFGGDGQGRVTPYPSWLTERVDDNQTAEHDQKGTGN